MSKYDKKAQEWLRKKEAKQSRFERKMWQISMCVVLIVSAVVCLAIAEGGF